MKTLFIYYSFTGSGDLVAERMREKGAEVRKVQTKKAMPNSFFWSVMTGGFLASIGHKMPLIDYDKSLDGVDRVIIGSPVWNGRLSCPVNTLLSELKLNGVPVDFVLCSGGGTAPKAEQFLAKEYPASSVLVLKEPKKYPEELDKLDGFFE